MIISIPTMPRQNFLTSAISQPLKLGIHPWDSWEKNTRAWTIRAHRAAPCPRIFVVLRTILKRKLSLHHVDFNLNLARTQQRAGTRARSRDAESVANSTGSRESIPASATVSTVRPTTSRSGSSTTMQPRYPLSPTDIYRSGSGTAACLASTKVIHRCAISTTPRLRPPTRFRAHTRQLDRRHGAEHSEPARLVSYRITEHGRRDQTDSVSRNHSCNCSDKTR